MSKLQAQAIKEANFSVDVSDSGSGGKIQFIGDIDMEDPSKILDPFFDQVHQSAVSGDVTEVEADFTKLNFLNSSGIKAIAKWIMKLAAVSGDEKYTIHILYDKAVTWQETSLPTLKFLVPDVVVMN